MLTVSLAIIVIDYFWFTVTNHESVYSSQSS